MKKILALIIALLIGIPALTYAGVLTPSGRGNGGVLTPSLWTLVGLNLVPGNSTYIIGSASFDGVFKSVTTASSTMNGTSTINGNIKIASTTNGIIFGDGNLMPSDGVIVSQSIDFITATTTKIWTNNTTKRFALTNVFGVITSSTNMTGDATVVALQSSSAAIDLYGDLSAYFTYTQTVPNYVRAINPSSGAYIVPGDGIDFILGTNATGTFPGAVLTGQVIIKGFYF